MLRSILYCLAVCRTRSFSISSSLFRWYVYFHSRTSLLDSPMVCPSLLQPRNLCVPSLFLVSFIKRRFGHFIAASTSSPKPSTSAGCGGSFSRIGQAAPFSSTSFCSCSLPTSLAHRCWWHNDYGTLDSRNHWSSWTYKTESGVYAGVSFEPTLGNN